MEWRAHLEIRERLRLSQLRAQEGQMGSAAGLLLPGTGKLDTALLQPTQQALGPPSRLPSERSVLVPLLSKHQLQAADVRVHPRVADLALFQVSAQ